jgi:glutamate synthase domain-containing protein 3
MSGGIAYVLDENGTFAERCNSELVGLEPLELDDLKLVRELLDEHERRTDSAVAARLLDHWQTAQLRFVKVMPHDYRLALEKHRDQPVSTGGHGLFTRESETDEAAA